MPNARIKNSVARAEVKGVVPSVRVMFTRLVSGVTTTNIFAGTPIGLLLALTYATDQSSSSGENEGDSPHVRIITN